MMLPEVEILTRPAGDGLELIVGLRVNGHDIVLPKDSKITVTHAADSVTTVAIEILAGSVRYVPKVLT